MGLHGNQAFEASLAPLFEQHVASFRGHFGPSEEGGSVRCFFSPGRVNLVGAHLDYNGGPVMPMAIQRGTFLALRPRSDHRVRLASLLDDATFEFDLYDRRPVDQLKSGKWYDYPLGVVLHERLRRPDGVGFDVLFGGNLAVGSGLSSSASICVGTAFALAELWELPSEPIASVNAALWAEREFVGVRCGIMDPYAVGLSRPGHLLWLDCRDRQFGHEPLDASRVCVAIADTGVRRQLAQGDFNQRVAECHGAFEALRRYVPESICLRDIPRDVLDSHRDEMEPAVARRAQHVVDEVERAFRSRDALRAGDLASFGEQMTAAHHSLRDLFEVSIPELDALVEATLDWSGALGARITGAGFGGCIVAAIERENAEAFGEHLSEQFERQFGRPSPVALFHGSGGPLEVRL